MLFTSTILILLYPLILLLYYIVPKRIQWILLLFSSLFFYASISVSGLFVLFCELVAVYLTALWLPRTKHKKIGLTFLVCFIVLLVFCLKEKLLSGIGLLLPLGISFYSLSALSYIFDVAHGVMIPQKNPFRLALFLSYFPCLVEGPIHDYKQLSSSLFSVHHFCAREISGGFLRIIIGYFKKLVIADRIGIYTKVLFTSYQEYQGSFVLLALFLYSIQLYADFTGGIDIALGISKTFGISLPENFRHPLCATSLSDYWRRWHITLGNWFKQYVFYPICTSRKLLFLAGKVSKKWGKEMGRRVPLYSAMFTVWTLTGLWHGFTFNFLLWGLFTCFFLLLEEEYTAHHKKREKKLPIFFHMAATFCLVALLRIFDCYPNLFQVGKSFASLFLIFRPDWFSLEALYSLSIQIADCMIIGASLIATIFLHKSYQKTGLELWERLNQGSVESRLFFFLLFCFLILLFGIYGPGYEASGFLYGQY